MSEADLLFADPEDELDEGHTEDEDNEPELIEYRVNFTRTAYVTESASITFEAEEGLDNDDLEALAWEAARNSRHGLEWDNDGEWDSGDEEIESIEEE